MLWTTQVRGFTKSHFTLINCLGLSCFQAKQCESESLDSLSSRARDIISSSNRHKKWKSVIYWFKIVVQHPLQHYLSHCGDVASICGTFTWHRDYITPQTLSPFVNKWTGPLTTLCLVSGLPILVWGLFQFCKEGQCGLVPLGGTQLKFSSLFLITR